MRGKEIGVDLVRERTKRRKTPNDRTGIFKGNFMLMAKVLLPLSLHWDTHPEGPNQETQDVGGKGGYRAGYAEVGRTLTCSDGPEVGAHRKGGEGGREIWSWGT